MEIKSKTRMALLLEELVDSETRYVQQLGEFIQHVYEPMEKLVGSGNWVLDKKEFQKIFCNFAIIHTHHKMLLAGEFDLEAAKSRVLVPLRNVLDQDPNNVLRSFTKLADYLKMYGTYAAGQVDSFKALTDANTSPKFSRWVESRLRRCSMPRLDSYLILPIQRVMRYPMLIDALIAAAKQEEITPDTDALNPAKRTRYLDKALLQEALQKLTGVAEKSNMEKRKFEEIKFTVERDYFEQQNQILRELKKAQERNFQVVLLSGGLLSVAGAIVLHALLLH